VRILRMPDSRFAAARYRDGDRTISAGNAAAKRQGRLTNLFF
jgi:hypothetical protein